MNDIYTQPEVLFNLAAFCLDLLLLFFLLSKPTEFKQIKNFRLLACTIAASAFVGLCSGLVSNMHLPRQFHYLRVGLSSLLMVLEESIPFLLASYMDPYVNINGKTKKWYSIIHYLLFLVFVVIMAVNVRFEFVIGYDETFLALKRGPLYPICVVLPIYYLVFILYSVLRDMKYMKRYVYITMSYAVFLPFLFLILQILGLIPGAVVSVGISIGLYIWYFAVENEDHRTLKDARKALEDARKVASDASKAKSIFLANMSHEIRTPMNAVLGLDEMILHTDNMTEIKKYATTIKASGKMLLEIVSNILDFSKLESGKMELMEEEYHLGKLLEQACSKGQIESNETGIEFKSNIDQNIPDLLYGARGHFLRIIETLIDVGFKNTKKGSVTLDVQLKNSDAENTPENEFQMMGSDGQDDQVQHDGEKVVRLWIQVRDTGMGLPERALSEAFDSFEKLEEDSLNEVEGTGLKLAVVKQLVDLMGAAISIDSVVEVGSTFTLILKQKQLGTTTIGEAREMSQAASKTTAEHSSYCAPEAKVLVVDDNNINLVVVSGLLKPTQAQVTTCESGTACLEMIKKTRYDIIFLDHLMPDMDGIETLRKAKTLPGNLNRYTPFIALTANSGPGLKQKFMNDGFTDYIPKPIDSSLLYEVFFKNISQDMVHKIPEEGGQDA